MKVKLKECSKCHVPSRLWRSHPPLCKDCAGKEKAKEEQVSYKPSMQPQRKVYTIPKKSKQQIARDAMYAPIARQFKKEHPYCEMRISPDCTGITTDVHHGAGKCGNLYFDTEYFVAGCRPCHDWAELHPSESKEIGLSFTRLDK